MPFYYHHIKQRFNMKSSRYNIFLILSNNSEFKDYLGTIFENNKKYGLITLTQPRIVEIIIDLVGLNYTSENVKTNDTPACSNNLLDNDPEIKTRVKIWNYRAVVGCLIYCNGIVRRDKTMATQQCLRLCNSP